MKIGICIGTSPGATRTRFALELAAASREQGHEVAFFLFDEGVYNALENASVKCVTAALGEITGGENTVSVCANMARFRGVGERNVAPYVEISNLLAFSQMVDTSDLVITTR